MSGINVSSLLSELRTTAAAAQGESPINRFTGGFDFMNALESSINQVNAQQNQASMMAQDFEMGVPNASLADAMISMQKASIAFQALTQVRNKIVAAYQDVMNMPV